MKFTKTDRRTALEKEIDAILECMHDIPCGTEEYDKVLVEYEKLVRLNDMIVGKKKMSPDAKAGILANAIGIGLVLWHEKAHVIVSKAWGMVIRGKI